MRAIWSIFFYKNSTGDHFISWCLILRKSIILFLFIPLFAFGNIEPTIPLDKDDLGPDLPTMGSSLLDKLFKKEVGGKVVYDIPYPFEKFMGRLGFRGNKSYSGDYLNDLATLVLAQQEINGLMRGCVLEDNFKPRSRDHGLLRGALEDPQISIFDVFDGQGHIVYKTLGDGTEEFIKDRFPKLDSPEDLMVFNDQTRAKFPNRLSVRSETFPLNENKQPKDPGFLERFYLVSGGEVQERKAVFAGQSLSEQSLIELTAKTPSNCRKVGVGLFAKFAQTENSSRLFLNNYSLVIHSHRLAMGRLFRHLHRTQDQDLRNLVGVVLKRYRSLIRELGRFAHGVGRDRLNSLGYASEPIPGSELEELELLGQILGRYDDGKSSDIHSVAGFVITLGYEVDLVQSWRRLLPISTKSSFVDQNLRFVGRLRSAENDIEFSQIIMNDRFFGQDFREVLFPWGRSLQKPGSYDPNPFTFPRELIMPSAKSPVPFSSEVWDIKDKIFCGYLEPRDSIECVSQNSEMGRYEFQLIENYRSGATPTVSYVKRKTCAGCHKAQTPIFSFFPWFESDDNFLVDGAMMLANRKSKFALDENFSDGGQLIQDALYHRFTQTISERANFNGRNSKPNFDLSAAGRMDRAVLRANREYESQKKWIHFCGVGKNGSKCRANIFALAMIEILYGTFDLTSPRVSEFFSPTTLSADFRSSSAVVVARNFKRMENKGKKIEFYSPFFHTRLPLIRGVFQGDIPEGDWKSCLLGRCKPSFLWDVVFNRDYLSVIYDYTESLRWDVKVEANRTAEEIPDPTAIYKRSYVGRYASYVDENRKFVHELLTKHLSENHRNALREALRSNPSTLDSIDKFTLSIREDHHYIINGETRDGYTFRPVGRGSSSGERVHISGFMDSKFQSRSQPLRFELRLNVNRESRYSYIKVMSLSKKEIGRYYCVLRHREFSGEKQFRFNCYGFDFWRILKWANNMSHADHPAFGPRGFDPDLLLGEFIFDFLGADAASPYFDRAYVKTPAVHLLEGEFIETSNPGFKLLETHCADCHSLPSLIVKGDPDSLAVPQFLVAKDEAELKGNLILCRDKMIGAIKELRMPLAGPLFEDPDPGHPERKELVDFLLSLEGAPGINPALSRCKEE